MNYRLLAEAIRSGQLSDAQVQAHFADEVFKAWYDKHYPQGKT
jgi:hypothetical protein